MIVFKWLLPASCTELRLPVLSGIHRLPSAFPELKPWWISGAPVRRRQAARLCWIPEIAHLIRQHNDANVLVMPGRFIDNNMARKIMDEFFTASFEGGRHQKRVDKIPVQK